MSYEDRKDYNKNHVVWMRVSEEEKKKILVEARKLGLTVSGYCRMLVFRGLMER